MHPDWKRLAGEAMVTACEQALGVQGVRALGRMTRRGQAWWSKLQSGADGARFPSWAGLLGILPAGLSEEEQGRLHARYTAALLLLMDPGLASSEADQSFVRMHAARLVGLQQSVHALVRACLYEDALSGLRGLEDFLTASDLACQPAAQQHLLGQVLHDRAVCELHLSRHPTAVHYALRSVGYLERSGDEYAEVASRHTLALARFNSFALGPALLSILEVQPVYERLKLQEPAIAARRDEASIRLRLGEVDQAYDSLCRLFQGIDALLPAQRFFTAMWATDAAVQRRDRSRSRYWLNQMHELSARHPERLNIKTAHHYERIHRLALEAAVTRLENRFR